jgi:hypothetical protein
LFASTPDQGDPANEKVVDYEVVQRQVRQQRDANLIESSEAMESEAGRRMIPRWKDNSNIRGFVHDQSAKTWALMEESGWNVKECKEPSHGLNSNFEKCAKGGACRSPIRG